MLRKVFVLLLCLIFYSPNAFSAVRVEQLLHSGGGDVPDRHWVVPALPVVVEHYELLNPTPERQFEGERPLTRFEVAAVLSRLSSILEEEQSLKLNLPNNNHGTPADVPRQHWAAPAVQQVLHNGLMSVHKDGSFRGKRYLYRFEWLVYLQQILEYLEIESPTQNQTPELKDLKPTDWAYPVAQEVLAWNLLPTPNQELLGKKPINRYDMAYSLHHLLQLIENNRFALKRLLQHQLEILNTLRQAHKVLLEKNIDPEQDAAFQDWNKRYNQLQIRFRNADLDVQMRQELAGQQQQLKSDIRQRMLLFGIKL